MTKKRKPDSDSPTSDPTPPTSPSDESLSSLLSPLPKPQLISLLTTAASTHPDVHAAILAAANSDPVHRKIFVHGLGWDTTAETLTAAFQDYGEIEDVNAVKDKASGKSKGYAFILFKTRAGAQNSLKNPQKKIGNRMTACQMASSGPVAAAPEKVPVSEYTQRKIYVSNVGADIDPKKLLGFFSSFGEIEEGPLGLDRETGKPRGFVLFVYKSLESAKKALEEPHKNFDGHTLYCQKAVDGPKPGKGGSNWNQSGALQGYYGSGGSHGSGGGGFGAFTSPGRPGHLMAPSGGLGYGPSGVSPAVGAGINPAIGQALTALLGGNPAASVGLTNLLGTLGSAGVGGSMANQGLSAVGGVGHGLQGGGYGSQGVGAAGVGDAFVGGYGGRTQLPGGGYGNQQVGQGGAGLGQLGHMGGFPPYMGR